MSYSFVIPCYCSSHTIREVVESTIQEMERIDRKPYEFILVDDHSPDEGATLQELKALANEYSCVKAIELAKNSGQHNASIAGMNYAKGDTSSPWMTICRPVRPNCRNSLRKLKKAMMWSMDTIRKRSTVVFGTSEAGFTSNRFES